MIGRPVVLGLTGSIGMGKSTVARMLRRKRVPVFDADATVYALQQPGGAALPRIEAAFPGTVRNGVLDRSALGHRVFENPKALRQLEAIVHPMVEAARQRFLRRHRREPIVALDVPLLFETGGDRGCDAVAVVSAPARVQRARVLARPGMTEAKFRAVLAAQLSDPAKRARADFIIPTGRGKRTTLEAVHAMLRELRAIFPMSRGGRFRGLDRGERCQPIC